MVEPCCAANVPGVTAQKLCMRYFIDKKSPARHQTPLLYQNVANAPMCRVIDCKHVKRAAGGCPCSITDALLVAMWFIEAISVLPPARSSTSAVLLTSPTPGRHAVDQTLPPAASYQHLAFGSRREGSAEMQLSLAVCCACAKL